jgi:hypothetical protein
MSKLELLISEIQRLPEPFLDELLKLARSLRMKEFPRGGEPLLLTERILARDWSTPAEDEAWRDL